MNKNAFITFLLLLVVVFTPALAQNIKTKHSNEMKQSYKKYIGKTVRYFLSNDSIRSYTSLVLYDSRPGLLTGARIELPNKDEIEIIVKEFHYVKQFDLDRKWSIDLFLNEKIWEIRVYRNTECILDLK